MVKTAYATCGERTSNAQPAPTAAVAYLKCVATKAINEGKCTTTSARGTSAVTFTLGPVCIKIGQPLPLPPVPVVPPGPPGESTSIDDDDDARTSPPAVPGGDGGTAAAPLAPSRRRSVMFSVKAGRHPRSSGPIMRVKSSVPARKVRGWSTTMAMWGALATT